MMAPLTAIVVVALLFVVYGLISPRPDCGGGCEGCTHSCDSKKDGYHE